MLHFLATVALTIALGFILCWMALVIIVGLWSLARSGCAARSITQPQWVGQQPIRWCWVVLFTLFWLVALEFFLPFH